MWQRCFCCRRGRSTSYRRICRPLLAEIGQTASPAAKSRSASPAVQSGSSNEQAFTPRPRPQAHNGSDLDSIFSLPAAPKTSRHRPKPVASPYRRIRDCRFTLTPGQAAPRKSLRPAMPGPCNTRHGTAAGWIGGFPRIARRTEQKLPTP